MDFFTLHAFIFTAEILLILFIFRCIIVSRKIRLFQNIIGAVLDKYEETKMIEIKNMRLQGKKEEEIAAFIEKTKQNTVDLITVSRKYIKPLSLTFSLNKWTLDAMFPYFTLNFALALDGKAEDIDEDLIT